jgi:hypothetical protein
MKDDMNAIFWFLGMTFLTLGAAVWYVPSAARAVSKRLMARACAVGAARKAYAETMELYWQKNTAFESAKTAE